MKTSKIRNENFDNYYFCHRLLVLVSISLYLLVLVTVIYFVSFKAENDSMWKVIKCRSHSTCLDSFAPLTARG